MIHILESVTDKEAVSIYVVSAVRIDVMSSHMAHIISSQGNTVWRKVHINE